jgi:hypothetical protein
MKCSPEVIKSVMWQLKADLRWNNICSAVRKSWLEIIHFCSMKGYYTIKISDPCQWKAVLGWKYLLCVNEIRSEADQKSVQLKAVLGWKYLFYANEKLPFDGKISCINKISLGMTIFALRHGRAVLRWKNQLHSNEMTPSWSKSALCKWKAVLRSKISALCQLNAVRSWLQISSHVMKKLANNENICSMAMKSCP